jgi:hypothetical protein
VIAMKDRKQVYELTLADLERFPIWEFPHLASDDEYSDNIDTQDEATVRPYAGSGPLNGSDGLFVVRARFTLADGTTMKGFLYPDKNAKGSDISLIQPSIVTERGHVSFWFGIVALTSEQKREAYQLLGREAPSAFPIRFESAVELVSGPISGHIKGFQRYQKGIFGRRVVIER